MRKIKLGISVMALFSMMTIVSCSPSKNTAVIAEHSNVKGNWILNSITYTGVPSGEKIKLTLLDEGNEACLTGSKWSLPMNGFGSYTIFNNDKNGCVSGERKINWSFRTENRAQIFQYKRLEDGVKAKQIADGYKFTIASIDNTSMVLQSQVAFENSVITINYNFTKQ